MTPQEKAREFYRKWSDHGWGVCHCSWCLREGMLDMRKEIATALREARSQGLEEAASKVDQWLEMGHIGCEGEMLAQEIRKLKEGV